MLGDGGAVAAQQRRQVAGVGEPGPRRRRRREHPPAQVRHRHHLPLQALGGVHGEDLHPVVRDGRPRRAPGRSPPARPRPDTPADSAPSRRAAAREVGHHVGERVEVLGARPARCRRGRAARTSASTPSTRRTSATRSGSGCVEVRAQRGQLTAERDDPAVPGGGIRVGRPRIADRVGQAGGVGVGGGLRDDLLGRRGVARRAESSSSTARRHSAAMSRPPSRQRGPVSTRIAAAPAVGSATSRSIATTSATSGTASRPGEADDLDGDAARAQRVGHRRGIGVAAHQHRRGRRGRTVAAGVVVASAPCGRRPNRVRPQRRSAARTGWCPAAASGPRPQRPHRDRPAPRLGGHRVGQMQRSRRVAPAGAQLQRGRRGCRPHAGSRW